MAEQTREPIGGAALSPGWTGSEAEWEKDLEAMVPKPSGVFRLPKRDVKGRVERDAQGKVVLAGAWDVWSFMDLPYETSIRVIAIDDDVAGQGAKVHIERAREQVRMICPAMPEEIVQSLTPRQMFDVAKISAGRSTGGPPEPGEPDSASSSPSPGGSTGGPTAS